MDKDIETEAAARKLSDAAKTSRLDSKTIEEELKLGNEFRAGFAKMQESVSRVDDQELSFCYQ